MRYDMCDRHFSISKQSVNQAMEKETTINTTG